ncbi:MAG: O-antigen ligase family protein [Candidatus Eisenbacteria bacterium]|uniref:O-antigen ligase family protein n=1 Tax=Eiseniibacteriota bacterium TaxID=2212470 RepID=A0A933W871_UNCEI|nr:O-antigen ligase family protein [Candidatus Eisenbacteria bacterium]
MFESPRTGAPWRLTSRQSNALLLASPAVAALVAALCLSQPVPWALAFAALIVASGCALLLWHRPMLAAGLVPALFPLPEFAKVFAYEVGALVAFALLLLAGLRARKPWVWKLDRIEVADFAFVAWGVVSLLWSTSAWWWLFGVRKYGMGALALWTASRLARDPRRRWDLLAGIAVAAITLSLATLAKAVQSGLLTTGSAFRRIEGTDLGWGTSNYIGALLVLMLPTVLHVGLNAPGPRMRWLGRLALPLIGLVMAIAASRGGALLLVGVSLVFLLRQRMGRNTWLLLGGLAVAVALLLLGPGSEQFLARFTSPREQGSVVVRLFLLRAGWRRVLAHLPFGMGLGQGIVEPDHLAAGGPHNFLVTAAYEVGIPGALLWLAVLAAIAHRAWTHARMPAHARTAQTLLFTLVTAVLNSTFEGTFEGLHFQFLFFWIVGLHAGSLAGDEPDAGAAVSPAPGTARAG